MTDLKLKLNIIHKSLFFNYSDTICDLGCVEELANYGEYSGAPSENQVYEYAKVIMSLLTKEHHPDGKALIMGGGIANFTNVATTFKVWLLSAAGEAAINGNQDKMTFLNQMNGEVAWGLCIGRIQDFSPGGGGHYDYFFELTRKKSFPPDGTSWQAHTKGLHFLRGWGCTTIYKRIWR